MADVPENLQVIKTELLSPSSPEKHKNAIKERLNLHVKRRQQQLSPQGHFSAEQNMNSEKHSYEEKQKELPKTRRPYTKKAEKTNTVESSITTRKRNKTKQISSANVFASTAAMQNERNDEDDGEGGVEVEMKTSNMRSPDVLSMVLSAKKQALMRDPEVQEFLAKMLSAIKN